MLHYELQTSKHNVLQLHVCNRPAADHLLISFILKIIKIIFRKKFYALLINFKIYYYNVKPVIANASIFNPLDFNILTSAGIC